MKYNIIRTNINPAHREAVNKIAQSLDYENFKFNFADDTNVQLLLRDSKNV